ncbi:MAG: YHS domain-containing protein [Legionellales bacterium]|nr:YHS domain-containing protein [Legionellales bacterium]
MASAEEIADLCSKLDWDVTYIDETQLYPAEISGTPWLSHAAWSSWQEPYKTTYQQYVILQEDKERSVKAVSELFGRLQDIEQLPPSWLSTLKLHSAIFPLAEFMAVVGNLRAMRFGRDSAWRNMACFGALDELRHTQIPLRLMHSLLRFDPAFNWTHQFYHTNNWIAIAARHFAEELLLTANPIEFALATNFVFETGFTNLQFIALSALAHGTHDKLFEKMLSSIQTDEARHAQIGPAVLTIIAQHDRDYAQYLLDKWFWRSWLLFSIMTGFAMDYFTPCHARQSSFKEFMQEWVIDHYVRSLQEYGMQKPFYWDLFLENIEYYHHMVYASAYTYRATTWFDFVMPNPQEREWLNEKYPTSWPHIAPIWQHLDKRWEASPPEVMWYTHGATPIGFCQLCQLVLCNGTPLHNHARIKIHQNKKYIFCSEPCEWIFTQEQEKYSQHQDVVSRILGGLAPGNVFELAKHYFNLDATIWGKDIMRGNYSWLRRNQHDTKK